MRSVLFTVLGILLLTGCAETRKIEKEIISVSIAPQKYLVERIAGDRYHINVLVPPGVSPETYELTPVQMRMLSDSRVYFITGHMTFEKIWRSSFGQMKEELLIVDLSEGMELISMRYAHGDHYHYGTDPHTWISPKSVRIMAGNIYHTLISIDPSNKDAYSIGYQQLLDEIQEADKTLTELFNSLEFKSFLIFHPALGYLARDYGLEQIPIEYEGKTPPPAYIKEIVDLSRERNLRAILIQKEFSADNVLPVAREIGGEVVVIDPLDENWYEQIIFIGNTLHKILSEMK